MESAPDCTVNLTRGKTGKVNIRLTYKFSNILKGKLLLSLTYILTSINCSKWIQSSAPALQYPSSRGSATFPVSGAFHLISKVHPCSFERQHPKWRSKESRTCSGWLLQAHGATIRGSRPVTRHFFVLTTEKYYNPCIPSWNHYTLITMHFTEILSYHIVEIKKYFLLKVIVDSALRWHSK